MEYKTAAKQAFSDILMYNEENDIEVKRWRDGVYETLIPTEKHVYTIESRRLNRELGVSSVNYGKNQYNTKPGYKPKN
jgi:hypothetical protein